MTGAYNREQFEDAYREFNGQIKLANVVIQAYAVASKNRRAMEGLKKMNLMDDQIAIDLGLPNSDKIVCDLSQKLISRQECLDISGHPPEGYDCSGCEHYAATRQILIDNE